MKKTTKTTKFLGTKKQRFEVLLEDIKSEVRLVHEQTSDLLALKPAFEKLQNNVGIIKTDVEIMKGFLKRKVDVEEFEALTKRVAVLEKRAHFQSI